MSQILLEKIAKPLFAVESLSQNCQRGELCLPF